MIAQTEVTIGNGTESSYKLPTNMYYNYSLTQQIFKAEEIGTAGAITSISFFYDYTYYFNLPGIKVYMMNIDKSSFESDDDIVDMTGTTLVYEGNVSATGRGWITITLDDEFDYNGTENLLVCVYDPVYDYPGSSYTYRYTETTDYMSISYYSDYICPDIDDLTSYSGNTDIYNFRSNIRLTIIPNASISCQRVNSLAASNITTSTADVSWLPGGSETSWVLKYGVQGFDVETEGSTVELTSTNYTINGLADNTPYDVFVKAVCSNDNESRWKRITFRTECGAIVSFPWSEDFNTYDDGPFSVPCWENEHLEGYGSDIFWIYPYGNESNNTGLIYLPDMTSGTLTKLVLPEMTIPDEGIYKFSIDVLRNSNSYADEGIRIFASTDGEIEGATELGFVSRDYTQSDGGVVTEEDDYGWYTYAFTIPFSGTCYIILRGESQYGSSTYMDNFVVREAYSEAEILTFTLPTQMSEATINSENGTIAISVANSTDMDALVPEITISDFAEISDPTITGEGNVRTFAYAVTAEAGNTKDWTITVTRAPVSHNAFITGFTFYGQKEGTEATIVSDTENGIYTVNAVAEWDLELYDIAPTVTVSVAATMTPESETSHDFTNPVNYTVTAEDGETTHTYAVTIVNDPDACITPWNIYASNITTNSATVLWEQAYTETSYRVKVSTEIMRDMTLTADVFDGIVDTTTMDIEGLTPGTLYYGQGSVFVNEYDYYANTGTNYLRFGDATNGNIIAMPQFETNGSAILLDFYTRPESYTNSNCGTFEVGYITDLDDAATFTALETYSYDDWSISQYERKIVNMSSVPAGSYFAFNHKANSYSWRWYIDDVVVRYVSNEAEIVDFDFPSRMSAPVIDTANATIADANIIAGTITGAKLANSTITGAKIANTTIEASNIKDATITGAKIANGTITGTQIQASTITGAKIASTTIEASNIKDGTITVETPSKQVKEYYGLLGLSVPAHVKEDTCKKEIGLKM